MKKVTIIIIILLILILGTSNSESINNTTNQQNTNTPIQTVIIPKNITKFIDKNYKILYTPIDNTSVNINISGYNKINDMLTSLDINCYNDNKITIFYTTQTDDEYKLNSVPVYDDTNQYKIKNSDISSCESFLRSISIHFDDLIKECKGYINTYQSFSKKSSNESYLSPIVVDNQSDYQDTLIEIYNTFKSKYDNDAIGINWNKNYIVTTQFAFYLNKDFDKQEAITYCDQVVEDFLTNIKRIKFNCDSFLGNNNNIQISTHYLDCTKNHNHGTVCFEFAVLKEITVKTEKTTVRHIR